MGERLVEEIQPGLLRQQRGDGEPLALAAGELCTSRALNPARSTAASASRARRASSRPSQAQRPRCGWRPISAVSSTVDWKASRWPCVSRPRNWAARRAPSAAYSPPHSEIVPASGSRRPASVDNNVVLPVPLRPRMARRCPSCRSKPSPAATRTVPILTSRSQTESKAVMTRLHGDCASEDRGTPARRSAPSAPRPAAAAARRWCAPRCRPK